MSFTRSKPGLRAVRKIGHNLSGTTHPTLPPIGGRPYYSRPKRNCSDLEQGSYSDKENPHKNTTRSNTSDFVSGQNLG